MVTTLPDFLPKCGASELMAMLIKFVNAGGYVNRQNNRKCQLVAQQGPGMLPEHLGKPKVARELQKGVASDALKSFLDALPEDMVVPE
jgi:hypothetical protein